MEPIVYLILLTAVTGMGGLALGGALAGLALRHDSRGVSLLVAFTAGIMLSVALLHILPEAFEHGKGPVVPAVCLVAGFGLTWLFNAWVGRTCHGGCGHTHDHSHAHERHPDRAGAMLAAAVALHNLPVGMAVGAAVAVAITDSTGAGTLAAVAVGLHNLPEGAAIAAPILSGGGKRGRAIGLAALSGFPTVVGGVLGYFVGGAAPALLSAALALAAGAMLHVILFELIPEALEEKKPLPAALIVAGIALGALLLRFIGHAH